MTIEKTVRATIRRVGLLRRPTRTVEIVPGYEPRRIFGGSYRGTIPTVPPLAAAAESIIRAVLCGLCGLCVHRAKLQRDSPELSGSVALWQKNVDVIAA